MIQDAPHELRGLAGGHSHEHALGVQGIQHLGNAVVELVLEDPGVPEALPVLLDGSLRPGLVHVIVFHEAVLQGRPDEGLQLVQVRLLNPERAEGVLYAGADSHLGIRQCSVQVE